MRTAIAPHCNICGDPVEGEVYDCGVGPEHLDCHHDDPEHDADADAPPVPPAVAGSTPGSDPHTLTCTVCGSQYGESPTVPAAAAFDGDDGRLAGQADQLRTAAALVEAAGADVYLYITLHPHATTSIGAQVTSPYGGGLSARERGHIEIAGMGVLAELLGAPVTVAIHPTTDEPLRLSCTGRFHGQPVKAYTHVPDDPDLIAAARRLAADSAPVGPDVAAGAAR
ncbi:hypothetical protein [Frankia sp. Cas4]|uniref:hypothetical protein n=1 Tax=Frankia sp. Cas4 TaxID=3073927 RepID=UPI002AD2C72B|nr:hypothetical protein [Frankia sp. Cas4]